jgi:uncharacterized protein (DUF2384 family)
VALETILLRATEVLATQQDALRWLGTPVPALKYDTPIAHLAKPKGKQAILTVLGRLEHGVF